MSLVSGNSTADVLENPVRSNKLRPIFFLAGLAGLPLCIWGWIHWHAYGWLIGLSAAVFLLTITVGEAVVATKQDVAGYRQELAESNELPTVIPARLPERKSLRQNPYFRAGIMGLPFCVFEWFWKHELVFLLGGGFFAGILFPTLYSQWKWTRAKRAVTDLNSRERHDG